MGHYIDEADLDEQYNFEALHDAVYDGSPDDMDLAVPKGSLDPLSDLLYKAIDAGGGEVAKSYSKVVESISRGFSA